MFQGHWCIPEKIIYLYPMAVHNNIRDLMFFVCRYIERNPENIVLKYKPRLLYFILREQTAAA